MNELKEKLKAAPQQPKSQVVSQQSNVPSVCVTKQTVAAPQDVPFKRASFQVDPGYVLQSIAVEELLDCFEKQSDLRILIFDVRDVTLFMDGHISWMGKAKSSSPECPPGAVLPIDVTYLNNDSDFLYAIESSFRHLTAIGKYSPVKILECRDQFELVVFHDQDSSTASDLIRKLCQLLFPSQTSRKLVHLRGGYAAWETLIKRSNLLHSSYIQTSVDIGYRTFQDSMTGVMSSSMGNQQFNLTPSVLTPMNASPAMSAPLTNSRSTFSNGIPSAAVHKPGPRSSSLKASQQPGPQTSATNTDPRQSGSFTEKYTTSEFDKTFMDPYKSFQMRTVSRTNSIKAYPSLPRNDAMGVPSAMPSQFGQSQRMGYPSMPSAAISSPPKPQSMMPPAVPNKEPVATNGFSSIQQRIAMLSIQHQQAPMMAQQQQQSVPMRTQQQQYSNMQMQQQQQLQARPMTLQQPSNIIMPQQQLQYNMPVAQQQQPQLIPPKIPLMNQSNVMAQAPIIPSKVMAVDNRPRPFPRAPLAARSTSPSASPSTQRYYTPTLTKSSSSSALPRDAAGPGGSSRNFRYSSFGTLGFGLSGLKNLGNTCFMNSIIQSLNSTMLLTRFFTTGSFRNFLARDNPMGSKGLFANSYAELVTGILKEQEPVYVPIRFKNVLESRAPQFQGNEQHDSQEFLAFLLDALHEDLNVAYRNPKDTTDYDNESVPDHFASERAWKVYIQSNWSIIVDMFQGQLRNRLQCLTCNATSTTYNTFMYLTLPIPPVNAAGKKGGAVYIEECIEKFIEIEYLDGDDAWNCPKCKCRRRAKKQLTISRLPEILLIHFKRFYFQGPFRNKIDTYIEFPVSGMDMSRYVPQSNEKFNYNLFAVSNHFGGLNGGHYTAQVFNGYQQKWFNFDDSRVSEIEEDNVKSKAAYILFYARDMSSGKRTMYDWWRSA